MGGYEGWAEKDSRHAKVQRAGLWGGRRNFAAGELCNLYCCYCMYRDLSKQTPEEQKQIQKSCAVVVTWEKEKLDAVQVGRGRKRNRNTRCSGHGKAWQKEPLQPSNHNTNLNPPPYTLLVMPAAVLVPPL